MKKIYIATILLIVFVFLSTGLSAQEEPTEAKEGKPTEGEVETEIEEQKPLEEMTREELIKGITNVLSYNRNVLNFIPQLKAEQDEDGNAFYSYTLESGFTKRLEGLDTDTLINLYRRVNSEASRLNTQRLMKQLDQLRQLERLRRMQQTPKIPTTPKVYRPPKIPKTPKVYTPPKIPTTPKVYTPPKIPRTDRY